MLQITTENFQKEVLESKIPVFVDMYAPWCSPCISIAPVLEKLQESYISKVKIVKIDIDENPEIAERYSVQSIPNMILFKNGKEVDRVIGSAGEAKFREVFDKVV